MLFSFEHRAIELYFIFVADEDLAVEVVKD